MRRNVPALIAATALAATLVACGGTGNGTVSTTTDASSTEQTATTSTAATGATATDDKVDKAADSASDKKEPTGAATATAGTDPADCEAAMEAAKAEGKTVVTGKVVFVDGPDMFKYEDVNPDMLGGKELEEGNTYVILELDEETHISGMGADGSPREGDDDHVGIGQDLPRYEAAKDTASQWRQYDGKRICVAGDAWFPTDVSFPLCARLSDAELLYVE